MDDAGTTLSSSAVQISAAVIVDSLKGGTAGDKLVDTIGLTLSTHSFIFIEFSPMLQPIPSAHRFL